jgi:hypothetical protein
MLCTKFIMYFSLGNCSPIVLSGKVLCPRLPAWALYLPRQHYRRTVPLWEFQNRIIILTEKGQDLQSNFYCMLFRNSQFETRKTDDWCQYYYCTIRSCSGPFLRISGNYFWMSLTSNMHTKFIKNKINQVIIILEYWMHHRYWNIYDKICWDNLLYYFF